MNYDQRISIRGLISYVMLIALIGTTTVTAVTYYAPLRGTSFHNVVIANVLALILFLVWRQYAKKSTAAKYQPTLRDAIVYVTVTEVITIAILFVISMLKEVIFPVTKIIQVELIVLVANILLYNKKNIYFSKLPVANENVKSIYLAMKWGVISGAAIVEIMTNQRSTRTTSHITFLLLVFLTVLICIPKNNHAAYTVTKVVVTLLVVVQTFSMFITHSIFATVTILILIIAQLYFSMCITQSSK